MLDDGTPWLDADPADAPARASIERCQWIEGEPSVDDSCKCGAPPMPGHPYCPAHQARAAFRVPARRVQAHFDRLAKEAWDEFAPQPLPLTGAAVGAAAG